MNAILITLVIVFALGSSFALGSLERGGNFSELAKRNTYDQPLLNASTKNIECQHSSRNELAGHIDEFDQSNRFSKAHFNSGDQPMRPLEGSNYLIPLGSQFDEWREAETIKDPSNNDAETLGSLASLAPIVCPARSLTFLTLNVCMLDEDAPNRWSDRLPRIVSMLQSYEEGNGPHIVGMQEVMGDFSDDLRARLRQYEVRWEDRGDDEGMALLFRRERFEYLTGGELNMSKKDREECGGCRGAGWTYKNRNAIWARLRDRRTQRTFYVYNTHFGGEDCHCTGSAIILANHIARRAFPADPVVVMGDFNVGVNRDRTVHESYQTLLNHTGLDNAYLRAQDINTTDDFSTGNGRFTNQRHANMIDHIMFSRSFQVNDADIDRTMFSSGADPVDCYRIRPDGLCETRDGTRTAHRAHDLSMYSDHWAVWANLRWSQRQEVSGQATLHLVSLRCNDALEATDEIYLKVNGETVWGPVDMDTGETRNIGISIPFHNYAIAELWEEDRPRGDPEDDDKFGCSVTIPQCREFNNVRIRYSFDEDKGMVGDANYTLEYFVTVE